MKRRKELDSCEQMNLMFRRTKTFYGVISICPEIHESQDKVTFLNDAKSFYDPETASSSGMSHVPNQPMSIPSPRGMPTADS